MRKLLHRIEEGMDNLKIKKKLYMLYLICVLIPIIITDSVIFFIVRSSEQEKQQHEMANIANAVSYNISNTISSIGETAKSIYTSKYINSFLMQEYESAPEYVLTYQEFFKDHLLENILGMNNLVFTFYIDNETIVNGGKVNKIENIRETKAYQSLVEQKKSKGIFFVYDESRNKISKKRQIVFLQKLDFYSSNKEKILKVGNTVIDALYWVKQNKQKDLEEIKKKYGIENKKYILLTMHRRENWGKPMEETLRAVRDYLEKHKDLYLVFPMHLNPLVREVAHKVLDNFERKILIDPLEYLEFIAVMDGARYIMTDSGGVQEEAPSLGKPTLVLRDTTERPEAIEAGTAKLVGTKYDEVIKYMELLEGELYQQMSKANNPYGDGKTSQRIREYLQSI